jgi:hypothetical protein
LPFHVAALAVAGSAAARAQTATRTNVARMAAL